MVLTIFTNNLIITSNNFNTYFQVGSCPSTHKYAYLNGDYCCQTNREKVGGTPTDLCDGSLISIGSECCENNAHTRCSFGTCTNHEDAG